MVRSWIARHPRGIPAAIFVLVAAIAVLGAFAIERSGRRSEQAQLSERAGTIASALERRANANASYLRAGAALFASRSSLPVAQFHNFARQLLLDTDYRGAKGIGWAQRVDPDQVAAFNRVMALEYGGEGVRLHPPLDPSRPYALPVTYAEPTSGGTPPRAVGFDLYSEPVRRAAIIEAVRTGRPTASGKLVLVGDRAKGSPGFDIFMPAFSSGPNGPRLRGVMFSGFNAGEFLASVRRPEEAGGLGIRLYDQAVGPSHLIASVGPQSLDGPGLRVPVRIANHEWVMDVTAKQSLPLSPLTIAVLVFGLAGATLLMVLARMLAQQAAEDTSRLVWFEQQISIRDSLTRELNHRVKNTLANVLSIVALTKRRADSLDEFTEQLEGRIRALSATHDLLTQSQWGSTPIRSVVEAELAPYSRDFGTMIQLNGPPIELAPNDALLLGLAIHELATNAGKYGALSQPGGMLSIEWHRLGESLARISWSEEGGPPVSSETPRGFGMELLERIVANELRNPVEMHFDPEGVHCTLTVPVRQRSPFAIREVPYPTGLREPKNSA